MCFERKIEREKLENKRTVRTGIELWSNQNFNYHVYQKLYEPELSGYTNRNVVPNLTPFETSNTQTGGYVSGLPIGRSGDITKIPVVRILFCFQTTRTLLNRLAPHLHNEAGNPRALFFTSPFSRRPCINKIRSKLAALFSATTTWVTQR